MDYKNLFNRFVTSIVLIFFLVFVLFNYDFYLPYIFSICYIIVFFEIFIFFKKRGIFFIFGIIYILISYVFMQLYFYYYFDKKIFLYFISIIIIFDTSSYLLGTIFGSIKMLPKISPNKTYFGFFLGFVITIFISLFLNIYFIIYEFNYALIFSILIILSSFGGDILESLFKRSSLLKNSSSILPGHGGLFDRMDSFLMAIIVFFILNYLH